METTPATASERQVWINDYFAEYVRASQFAAYMGKAPTNIIVVKYELETERGKTINIPLITRLKSAGVTGSQVLDGNEEELGNYNCAISIDWRRNAVTVPKSSQYTTEIDLLNAAKDMLKEWETERLRDDIIEAFAQIVPATSTVNAENYGSITDRVTGGGREILSANYVASESDKNSWLTNNSDRILFGATQANDTGTHSTSLSGMSATNDIMTTLVAEKAKLMAKVTTGRRIRPFKLKDGREYFVLFTNPWSFRDVKKDNNMIQANRDARAREGSGMDSNPLFQDGDLLKDGIIYRQVEEMPTLTAVGPAGGDIGLNFLSGAQAVGVAWGQEPSPITDRYRDYGFRPGVGIEELLGVSKLHYNGVQQGIVTVYTPVVSSAG